MNTENMKHISSKVHLVYISLIILLLLAMVSEFIYFHKNVQTSSRVSMKPDLRQGTKETKKGSGRMMMTAAVPPTLSDQQTQQLSTGTASATIQKTFNITGGNFYFVPNKITVNKGDQVTFVMTNAGGVHDLVIDELGVKTPILRTGQAATVTFTASKTGSFIYYCDVPEHKSKGMWGTLIIQ